MRTVLEANSIAIIIALLVGLAIGWWIFRRSRRDAAPIEHRTSEESVSVSPPAAVPPAVEQHHPLPTDGPEGNGIFDEGAAAATDVAGEVLGVKVHSELPGADGPPDNLSIMKGVGPKFVARLHENGITRFTQLAALSANEVGILDDKLGPFKGRLARDRVVEQASYLARGDRDGFEAKFGKLGSA